MPKTILGWDTATLELLSDITFDSSETDSDYSTKKLHLGTNDSDYKVQSKMAHQEGNKVVWDVGDEDIRLPVYHRFANSLHFDLGGTGLNPLSSEYEAIAVLWLRDLTDYEEKE